MNKKITSIISGIIILLAAIATVFFNISEESDEFSTSESSIVEN